MDDDCLQRLLQRNSTARKMCLYHTTNIETADFSSGEYE
jgi:hypothetical protein